MNFEIKNTQENNKKIEDSPSEKLDLLKQRTGAFFEEIFDTYSDPKKRFRRIEIRSGGTLGLIMEKDPKIIENLIELCESQNKQEFIEGIMSVLNPVLEYLSTIIEEDPNFMELNGLLQYGISGDTVHIHLNPNGVLSESNIKKDLNSLADVVWQNKDIAKITASSDLVTRRKSLFENFGFIIDGFISDEDHEKHFKYKEKGTVTSAHMDRDDFLRIYKK